MRYLTRTALAAMLMLLLQQALAATVNQTLYINRGTFVTVNSTASFPYFAYNGTSSFDARNTVINVTTSDMLVIKVINNDTVVHGFDVKGYAGVNAVINPGDSLIDTLTFASERIYIYYDSYQYPKYRYMGAAGMICVNNSASAKFWWNIKEHQVAYNNQLAAGNAVSWGSYDPDYFTINGLSHPDLQNDTTARVTGSVGDTIYIFVANTGQSSHSIHFHGFHCRAVFSTVSQQTGWVKDTFPLKSMEAVVLEMVPDKVGEYSVHDHNLVAVSGGGTHPNGMFIIMQIQ